MRHVSRVGSYFRVADQSWRDSLSAQYSRRRGGRWNPPGKFGVVYLNSSVEVARAQVRQSLEPRGIRPEDLQSESGPLLVHTEVPESSYVNAVTKEGLKSLGLPETYPRDKNDKVIPHEVCQPIGQRAWDASERGIACRSAASTAPPGGEELALFDRQKLPLHHVEQFKDWYW